MLHARGRGALAELCREPRVEIAGGLQSRNEGTSKALWICAHVHWCLCTWSLGRPALTVFVTGPKHCCREEQQILSSHGVEREIMGCNWDVVQRVVSPGIMGSDDLAVSWRLVLHGSFDRAGCGQDSVSLYQSLAMQEVGPGIGTCHKVTVKIVPKKIVKW